MTQMRLIRDLKIKDLEIYHLTEGVYGDFIGYIFIIDFRRRSTLEDFPYSFSVEETEEFGKENYIKALILSPKPLSENQIETSQYLIEGLIGEKPNCDINFDFVLIKDLKKDRNMILLYANRYLTQKYGLDFKLSAIKNENFNFLSQD